MQSFLFTFYFKKIQNQKYCKEKTDAILRRFFDFYFAIPESNIRRVWTKNYFLVIYISGNNCQSSSFFVAQRR
jgi:hypothetical protein